MAQLSSSLFFFFTQITIKILTCISSDYLLMTSQWLWSGSVFSFALQLHCFTIMFLCFFLHLLCFRFYFGIFFFLIFTDARCGKDRQRFRAKVYWGDTGRSVQPSTSRATDTHGRRQSLYISVELILLVCSVNENQNDIPLFLCFHVWIEFQINQLMHQYIGWCPLQP